MQIQKPKPISDVTTSYLINNLLDKTGIRPKMDGKRTELMQTHGFRKFFETTCITNGMNESYVESVMGHKDRLKNAYFKPTEDQILEGSDKVIGYIEAMPYLTINPTEEENERLKKQITKMQHESQEWKEIKKMVFEMKNSMTENKTRY